MRGGARQLPTRVETDIDTRGCIPPRRMMEGAMGGEITVYTDGAARQNPGPGGWGAIVLTGDEQVIELGAGVAHTTNNKMEMSAAIEALAYLANTPGKITIYTDSSYLVRGITDWIKGWRRRGWTTADGSPVLNRELWERLSELVAARGRAGGVSWLHVRGHAGVPGNERCDEIATSLADGHRVELYRGPKVAYGIDLERPASAQALTRRPTTPSAAPRPTKPGAAYSYLSLVGGQLMRHANWADCEQRVRGVSGARFKKAMSPADEEAIARSWGCAPL